MTRRIFILPLIALVVVVYVTCLYAMGAPSPRKYIPLRVLVVKGAKNVSLRIKGPYKMTDFTTGEILREERASQNFRVSCEDINPGGIKILPEKGSHVYINDRQFRGIIDIIKGEDTNLLVINHIDLEEYLYGVLYHEVSHRWPIEVLKAQAIAARTYALYQKLISKNKYFDLTSDIYSQVYGGRTSETWRTIKAVDLTEGQVLTYDGKIFPSYYHATCGGRTSDASTLWDIDIPVLRGRVCDFCSASPHYRWRKELSMDYIQNRLRDAGYKIKIVSIEVLERDEAGRALDIMLKGENEDLKLSGNKFRLMMDPNIIRSTNFEIQGGPRFVTFHGKGWGHGIGMCQWGAYYMAEDGWKAEDILGYYYPGAEIARIE